jgi:hypothetical protein
MRDMRNVCRILMRKSEVRNLEDQHIGGRIILE